MITSGFDSTDLPPCVTGCTNPAQAVSLADCVILPLPVTTDGSTINAPFSRVRITLDQVLNALHPDQLLVGGQVSELMHKEVAVSYTHLHRSAREGNFQDSGASSAGVSRPVRCR